MKYLPCEIIETNEKPGAAVIWLHGLGATGHDFVPLVPELRLPADMKVRFVFPHAPSIPVTVNGGMVMPAWYDILSMSIAREIDTSQIMASAQATVKLVEREIERGIPSHKIVIAGFSQGGAVAYQAALSCDKSLAGLMALSTYYATKDTIKLAVENKDLPIHIFHGSQDQVVPEILGKQAFEALNAQGYRVDYQSYPMEHSVHPQQVKDMSAWLQKVL